MTIYARTERGQALAFDAKSGLPYKLRVLLKLVDGSTLSNVFEDSLHAFGDVRSVFETLESAGLIKSLPDKAHLPPACFAAPLDEPLPSILEPHNVRQWFETKVGDSEIVQQSTLTMDANMGPETIAVAYGGKSQAAEFENVRLQRLIKLMGEFVRQHLPELAQPLLEKLDDMTSLEMFTVSLKGYEQLIKPFGALAEAHLAQLKSILRDES